MNKRNVFAVCKQNIMNIVYCRKNAKNKDLLQFQITAATTTASPTKSLFIVEFLTPAQLNVQRTNARVKIDYFIWRSYLYKDCQEQTTKSDHFLHNAHLFVNLVKYSAYLMFEYVLRPDCLKFYFSNNRVTVLLPKYKELPIVVVYNCICVFKY